MKHRLVETLAVAALLCASLGAGTALAQSTDAAKPAAAAPAPAPPPGGGWAVRCASTSRQGSPDCAVDESAVMNNTGQLVVAFSVRVPNDTRAPALLVQIPLGLFLPAQLKLQVDDGQALSYPIQTCDASGCYVGMPLDAGLLAQMKSGQQLKTVFQNMQHKDMTISLPLQGFADAFAKIQ
ncbi:invasion associated locus B family protein [Labrys miyagiensis]|uniref:Invasion associated locus B family protein n=1 Tax=Labrys miyagiensis TaxID=346912 RepID=A0ABQ6CHK0_9HYPH|nr:invasion associated locus B family protein [Labrys miyagiensis]GLS17736.1 invasion associated locus B family protein [Labrys miyagiensis]